MPEDDVRPDFIAHVDANGRELAWRVTDLERRLSAIEHLEPAIMNERIRQLSSSVDAMRKSFITLSISIVSAAVIFAFGVLTLLGRHP